MSLEPPAKVQASFPLQLPAQIREGIASTLPLVHVGLVLVLPEVLFDA